MHRIFFLIAKNWHKKKKPGNGFLFFAIFLCMMSGGCASVPLPALFTKSPQQSNNASTKGATSSSSNGSVAGNTYWPASGYSYTKKEIPENLLYSMEAHFGVSGFESDDHSIQEEAREKLLVLTKGKRKCTAPSCINFYSETNTTVEIAFWISMLQLYAQQELITKQEAQSFGRGLFVHQIKDLLKDYDTEEEVGQTNVSKEKMSFLASPNISCSVVLSNFVEEVRDRTSSEERILEWLENKGYNTPQGVTIDQYGLARRKDSDIKFKQENKGGKYILTLYMEELYEAGTYSSFSSFDMSCRSPEEIYAADLLGNYKFNMYAEGQYWVFQLAF